ncbi:hypothetical protein FRB93_004415 [Tulasnella sp. JGI-2019a]|nr:hypothetical protein FRB93_004415 [Tulasnella sp. JGI-2019a]
MEWGSDTWKPSKLFELGGLLSLELNFECIDYGSHLNEGDDLSNMLARSPNLEKLIVEQHHICVAAFTRHVFPHLTYFHLRGGVFHLDYPFHPFLYAHRNITTLIIEHSMICETHEEIIDVDILPHLEIYRGDVHLAALLASRLGDGSRRLLSEVIVALVDEGDLACRRSPTTIPLEQLPLSTTLRHLSLNLGLFEEWFAPLLAGCAKLKVLNIWCTRMNPPEDLNGIQTQQKIMVSDKTYWFINIALFKNLTTLYLNSGLALALGLMSMNKQTMQMNADADLPTMIQSIRHLIHSCPKLYLIPSSDRTFPYYVKIYRYPGRFSSLPESPLASGFADGGTFWALKRSTAAIPIET